MKARPSGMLSFAAAARRVERAPATLLKWIERGEFPRPVEIGGRRYYHPDQIERWLAKTYAAVGINYDDGTSRPAA